LIINVVSCCSMTRHGPVYMRMSLGYLHC